MVDASVFGLAQSAMLFAPTKYALDEFTAGLRHAVTGACGCGIRDDAGALFAGLGGGVVSCDMRRDFEFLQSLPVAGGNRGDEKRGWALAPCAPLFGVFPFCGLGAFFRSLPHCSFYAVTSVGTSTAGAISPDSSALRMISSTGVVMGTGFPSVMVSITAGCAFRWSAMIASQ